MSDPTTTPQSVDLKQEVDSNVLLARVQAAAEAIKSVPAFQKVGEDDKVLAPDCYILRRLATLGIYEDAESLELLNSDDCSEGEARRVFCENGEPNLPVVRFKRMWRILKGGETSHPQDIVAAPGPLPELAQALREAMPPKPFDQWSDTELVEALSPDCQDGIMEQLRKRSHGRRFVAFHDEDENVVNQSLTLQMLRQARRRETPHHQKLADALFQLYAVGDWPSAVYVECPIHPGVLLSDGYCDECGQGWEGVSHEARAFVRLMSGDLSNQSVFVRKAVIKMALEGLDALRTEFPKVSRQYDSLEREGKLPSLRRRLSSEGGRQDPFGGNKRY